MLADQVDAIASIKNGLLLFLDAEQNTFANGDLIPVAKITRKDGDKHSYTTADNNNYNAVRAYYKDAKNKKAEAIVNADNLEPKPKPKNGRGRPKKGSKPAAEPSAKLDSGAKVKTLRHIYATRNSAFSGARTAFKKLKRGVAQFSLSLAVGRPELFPQMPVIVDGFKYQIDLEPWTIAEITHKWDNNGGVSDIKLEARLVLDDDPPEDSEPEQPEAGA